MNNKEKIIKLVTDLWNKEMYSKMSFNELICSLQDEFYEWSYVHDYAFISDDSFIKFIESEVNNNGE